MGETCGTYFGKCNQGLFCVKKSGQLKQGVCACGPNCLIYCPYGRILDKNGCPTCRCKPKSCPPVCDKYCHFGKLLDKNGCQTCVCRQKACPQLSCNVFCLFGAETDINGCDTCKCKPKCMSSCVQYILSHWKRS
ncbi:antistasin-like [Hydractinia symbiolongicarpus]|uniref:antistasin-like n=1 Tax=Hydractinia symbiolongicarpus TaxID=13093 RepID=UPI00254A1BE4|nr:antistasin-like [Hydractinia symbiolongicarpus]